MFSNHFYKRKQNFVTSCLLASLHEETLSKWCLLLKERICSQGSKFFTLRADPNEEGITENGRVDSPGCVSAHLKFIDV